jgi:pentatricopeptide repeat protein
MEFLRSPLAYDVPRSLSGIADVEGIFLDVAKSAHRLNRVDLCRRVVSDMRRLRVPQSAAIFESVMKMLASKRCYDGAISLYNDMLRAGIEPTTDSTSCLINFLVQNGQAHDAARIVRSASSDVRPSIRTYTGLLKLVSSSGEAALALDILKDMRSRNIRVDQLAINMVLSALSRCRGYQAKAVEILREFKASHNFGDAISYRVVIKGLEASGQLALAHQVLHEIDLPTFKLEDRLHFEQVRLRLDMTCM